jgi:sec-independent protein translocase protein TatB
MFDIGFAELFLLSLIGLLVLGPERLPAVARTIGGFVRKARISYHNLKRTVEAELAAADAANPVKQAQKELESVQRQVNELKGQLDQDLAPALGTGGESHDPQRPQGEQDAPPEQAPETEASSEAEATPEPEALASPTEEEQDPKPDDIRPQDADQAAARTGDRDS